MPEYKDILLAHLLTKICEYELAKKKREKYNSVDLEIDR